MKKTIYISIIALFAIISIASTNEFGGQVGLVKKVMIPKKSTVETNYKIMDFTFELDGKEMKFSDLTKDKIVFLNVWATWCGPCRREIPDIIEIQKEMKKDVIVIGLASERGGATAKGKVEAFAKENNINYLNILNHPDLDKYLGEIAYGDDKGIKSIPTTFIVDKKGYITQTKIGMASKAEFISLINKSK